MAGVLVLVGAVFAGEKPELLRLTLQSDKVLYCTDEKIMGTLIILNTSREELKVLLRAWLEAEINERSNLREKRFELRPDERATWYVSWKASTLGKYGYALVGEALLDDEVIARAEDYFNVCDNYWNVALIAAGGFLWQQYENFKPKKDFHWVRETIKKWRREYYNGFEKFFWAPDDFIELAPDQDIWWSGQARYLETKAGLKALIEEAHRNGMRAITYAKRTGGGPTGAEIARRHPEWVWHNEGRLAISMKVKKLHRWNITAKKHWGGWVPVNWNMNDPKVVLMGIKELADSTKMFGWDGARWDGNFDVRAEVYDLEGNLIEKLTPDEVDSRNAENMRWAKRYLLKRFPRFVFGYNWTQGNWAQSMAIAPRESLELCRGGGLIMNEYINQAQSVQHPLHRWKDFAMTLLDDVERIKRLGGYYGLILSSRDTADGKYSNIFAYSAGAHPYYHHHWGAFITRYSAFVWDNRLKRIHNPESLLIAPASLWWKHWVFERKLTKDHRELIVHLINPPLSPTVGAGKKPEDIPPPVEDVRVRLFRPLLKEWRPVRATRLSPQPPIKEQVPIRHVERIYVLSIPEVHLWNILIIDLKR